MSVRAVSWALDQKMPPTRKIILVCLADCAADDVAFPRVKRIAERAGVTDRQVQRHLRALEDDGFIEFVQQRKRANGSDSTREYRLLMSPRGDDVQMSPHSGGDIQMSPPERMNTQEKELAPKSRRGAKNIVWDTLVEHFGSPSSKSETSNFAKTTNEIIAVLSEIEPLFSAKDESWVPFVRQQIGLRVAQMGESQYRTHPALRNNWTRLGSLAGLSAKGVPVVGAAVADPWTDDEQPNPLGQLTECETCGEDLPHHHEDCPWHPGRAA